MTSTVPEAECGERDRARCICRGYASSAPDRPGSAPAQFEERLPPAAQPRTKQSLGVLPTCGCRNTLAWCRHDYCPASESWRRPKETAVSSRDGMASTRSGG